MPTKAHLRPEFIPYLYIALPGVQFNSIFTKPKITIPKHTNSITNLLTNLHKGGVK